MPQLFSRMDDSNWLTPSIADILDQGAAPPGGDGTIREQIKVLQDDLAALETPARVVNVRATPSYTLFILQPETVGRLGSRRTVTFQEIRRSAGQIADKHKEWRLGFVPQVEDTPDSCGIMVRTEQHRPLSLRRLLVRGTFRDYTSTLAFALGSTLDQRLIVNDLQNVGHLVVVGEGNARQQLISSIVLTLILFNTPTEIRTVITGESGGAYSALQDAPHAYKPYLPSAEATAATLAELSAEAQRRLEAFYEEGVNVFNAYNNRRRDQGKPGFARILVVVDSLSDATVESQLESIVTPLRELLLNGAEVGIHLIYSINSLEAQPESLRSLTATQIWMRSAAGDIGDKVKNFHSSLLRFVDAFVVETGTDIVIPVELCAVSPEEIAASVAYWKQVMTNRSQEREDEDPRTAAHTATGEQLLMSRRAPVAGSIHERASMLAAYLGWLSVGALHDIFGLSDGEAAEIIASLQETGVIEGGEGGMFRFIRLADVRGQ